MDRRTFAQAQKHARSMIQSARNAGAGLAAIAVRARGDLIGPEFFAALQPYLPPNDGRVETMPQVIRRAQQIRIDPTVNSVGTTIAERLIMGSIRFVDDLQRAAFVKDQKERARIYNRATNPGIRIEYREDIHELELLASMPVNGDDRNEWLARAADRWREAFRSAIVRSIAGTKGGAQAGIRAMGAAIGRTFDTWVREVGNFANLCVLVALQASNRSFMNGLMPPERRKGIA